MMVSGFPLLLYIIFLPAINLSAFTHGNMRNERKKKKKDKPSYKPSHIVMTASGFVFHS